MSTRSALLAAARQLAITVGGATDAKVINAGAPGPRPEKPYLTVRLTSPGGGGAPAERLDSVDDDGAPMVVMRERREASVSIQGYGTDSGDWLDALQLGLDSPDSLAAQEALGVSAAVQTPVSDLSTLLDTAEETRFSLELVLRYRLESTPAAAVELLTAEISGSATEPSGTPAALDLSTTLDTTAA